VSTLQLHVAGQRITAYKHGQRFSASKCWQLKATSQSRLVKTGE